MSQERLDLEAIKEASKQREYLDKLDLSIMWSELDLLVPDEKQD